MAEHTQIGKIPWKPLIPWLWIAYGLWSAHYGISTLYDYAFRGGLYIYMSPSESLIIDCLLGLTCMGIGVFLWTKPYFILPELYFLPVQIVFSALFWVLWHWISSSTVEIVYLLRLDYVLFLFSWLTFREFKFRELCKKEPLSWKTVLREYPIRFLLETIIFTCATLLMREWVEQVLYA